MFEISYVLLKSYIPREPGKIVGPIAKFIGIFLNFIFDLVMKIIPSGNNALGISIILFTLFVRFLMLPLAIKSQKSMNAMQKIQPEIEKLNKKYEGKKDQESQQKQAMELNQLYSEHKANPLSGCLPLFIQMPIFMAMYSIMGQPYQYVDKLGVIYSNLADKVMAIPNFGNLIAPFASAKIPPNQLLDVGIKENMMSVLNKFVYSDWTGFLSKVPAESAGAIEKVVVHKAGIEQLFTLSMTENTGLSWPSILIPVLAVLTSFLTSYLSMRQSKSMDPQVASQQKMMMLFTPIMMGFFSFNIPGGVGLYWISSNIFQLIQMFLLNKVLDKDDNLEIVEKPKNKGK